MATFSTEHNSLALRNSSNQIQLGTPDFLGPTTTISCANPSASRTITIPDAGANSSLLLSAGSQTISGSQTFGSAITITPTSNQIVLGSSNTTTISASAPSASRTYTLPDGGANANILLSQGSQTVAGANTFSSSLTDSAASNQIIIAPGGSSNTYTLTANSAPSATRLLSFYDPGMNCSLTFGAAQVVNITTTATMTATQSGSTVYITNTGSAYTITLPAVASGLRYKFVCASSSLNAAVTISCPSAILQGNAIAANATVVTNGDPISNKTNTWDG